MLFRFGKVTGCPWIAKPVVLAIHEAQLATHGGQAGIRDEGLLESALARPQNLCAYGNPDAFDLAAAYAFGISANHPFVDGNKRTAFVVSVTFLRLSGLRLTAPKDERVTKFLRLAAGEIGERELADWFRDNSANA